MNDFASIVVLTKSIPSNWIQKFVREIRQSQCQETEIIALDDGQDQPVSDAIRDLALRDGPVRILRTASDEEMSGIKQAIDRAKSDYVLVCRPFMTFVLDLKKAVIQLKASKSGWLLGQLQVGEAVVDVNMDYEALQVGTLRLAPLLFFDRRYVYPNEMPPKGHFPYQFIDYLLRKKVAMTTLDEVWATIYPEVYDGICNSIYSIDPPVLPLKVRNGPGDRPLAEALPPPVNPRTLARERGARRATKTTAARKLSRVPAPELPKIIYPATVVVVPLANPDGARALVSQIAAGVVGKDAEIMVVGQIVPGIEQWIVSAGLRALIYQEPKPEWEGFVLAKQVIWNQSDLIYIRPGAKLEDLWFQKLKGNIGDALGSTLGRDIFLLSQKATIPGNCQSFDDLLGKLNLVEG